MIRLVRRLLLVALAVLVAGIIVYAFLPKPVGVDVASVTRGPLMVTVNEDGKTRIKERYVVSSPLPGRLLRINLDVGDSVESGDTVLAVIEPADPELLDARAVAEAEARVKATEASLKQAGPKLEAAQAALEFAESELARARELYERNSIPRHELDNTTLLFRTRTEEFRAAKFAEEIARFELELAQAALLRTRPDASGDGPPWRFEIPSPITARVLRIFQESAAVVSAGTPLLELGDPVDLELEIDVLSRDAVKVDPGAKVFVEQWGGDAPLNARVRLVEPSGFTKISALGVEEQRVNVIADFVDPLSQRANLGDGFRVEVRIVVWEHPDVLQVPNSALFRHRGEWAVFVILDSRAKMRMVDIGMRNDLVARIIEGLSENEQVIVHPSDRVEDGVAVFQRRTEGMVDRNASRDAPAASVDGSDRRLAKMRWDARSRAGTGAHSGSGDDLR